jgi:hypothetical protein
MERFTLSVVTSTVNGRTVMTAGDEFDEPRFMTISLN